MEVVDLKNQNNIEIYNQPTGNGESTKKLYNQNNQNDNNDNSNENSIHDNEDPVNDAEKEIINTEAQCN